MQRLQRSLKQYCRTVVTALLLIPLSLMPLQAQAAGNCSVSASGVSFGSYTYISPSPTDGVGNIRVSCSLLGLLGLLINYNITLSHGNSGTYAPRTLVLGANNLTYNLYTDSARTKIWGDNNAGTSSISDGYLLGLLTVVRNYPVYGRLAAAQNKPAGSYTDTIIVTLTY